MSRFNKSSTGTKTENLAGGEAFSQSPELELISILLTSFAQDQYYKSATDTFKTLKSLIPQCDKKFVAKSAIYARNEFGMRSISHVVAAELARHISGTEWAKNFYNKIIRRPDDMTEIMSYYQSLGSNPSNAMKKGFAMAFGRFDAYQLAKYRGENKAFKLVDVVNLVRPKPNEKNERALKGLIEGTLKSSDTWETKLTQAGQAAESDEHKAEMKSDVWKELLTENKLGYFALLRNLANILSQAPDMVDLACERLVNETAIKKSLVLPFRFLTAISKITELNHDGVRKVLVALNKAIDISCSNVPKFTGKTLIVLDVSLSMRGRPSEIGALFSAILYKSNVDADFMTFDQNARYQSLNPVDSTLSVAKSINFTGGGTNFHSIFQTANKKYDRIIILSDMQGWIGYHSPVSEFSSYKNKFDVDPFVYSFDLQGYGTMQFPERKVFCLAGFSEKVFDIMSLLEEDKKALINKVNDIEL